jgi:hypothetical protein
MVLHSLLSTLLSSIVLAYYYSIDCPWQLF